MSFDPSALSEIVRNSGVSYKENRISFILSCPRCYKKDKLYIRKQDGRFVCWSCAAKESFQGRCEYALSEILSLSYKHVRDILYGQETVSAVAHWTPAITDFFGDSETVDEEAFSPEIVSWPEGYSPITDSVSAPGAQYLEGRGIPVGIASEYGIRYSEFQSRVYFPVEYAGGLVGWQGRLIKENTFWDHRLECTRTVPKILSSIGIPREKCVMFSSRLLGAQHAILTEGPIDAIKAHLCGGNVCTMGKIVTKSQINVLRAGGIHKIYVALDPDAAEEAGRLIRGADDIEFYNMRTADGTDLGAMAMEDVFRMFKSANRMNAGHFFGYIKDFSK